jgi:hypothetical protein
MNRWSQTDSTGAGTWLGTLPQGESRDTAVTIYARSLSSSDPKTATQWAQTIGNENKRNSQIESIVRNWLGADAAAATGWINASSLPYETKVRLLPKQK